MFNQCVYRFFIIMIDSLFGKCCKVQFNFLRDEVFLSEVSGISSDCELYVDFDKVDDIDEFKIDNSVVK